jgi:hypothetical protein
VGKQPESGGLNKKGAKCDMILKGNESKNTGFDESTQHITYTHTHTHEMID